MKMRKAIALIELIFAMVIIAITLLSVPNLITQTTKASNQAITQEAISNAASYISMIMSSFWDQECVDPKRGNPILVVDKNTTGLTEKEVNATLPGGGGLPVPTMVGIGLRAGSPVSTSRRFATNGSGARYRATPISGFGSDVNDTEPNDIDDFHNKSSTLILETPTSAKTGDYKDITINMKTQITYIDDTPNPSFNSKIITFDNPFDNEANITTNIKKITVILTSTKDKNKKIILKAFSSNVGSSILKERVF